MQSGFVRQNESTKQKKTLYSQIHCNLVTPPEMSDILIMYFSCLFYER